MICSCGDHNDNSDGINSDSSVSPNRKESLEESSLQDSFDDYGFFEGNINITLKKNEYVHYPVTDNVLLFDEKNILEVEVYLKFNAYKIEKTVPVDIYAFCDGRLLDIAVDDSFDEKISIDLKKIEENYVPVKIQGKDDVFIRDTSEIYIIANVNPKYFTDMGNLYEVPNILAFSCYADTSKFRKTEKIEKIAIDSDYLAGIGDFDVDIGAICIEQSSKDGIINWNPNLQIGKKLTISKEMRELFAKAYIISEYDTDDYLLVLCDGEIIPVFDGSKIIRFDNQNGKRVLNYQIPQEYYPMLGEHAIQGIAIPVPVNIGDGIRGRVCENSKRYVNIVD